MPKIRKQRKCAAEDLVEFDLREVLSRYLDHYEVVCRSQSLLDACVKGLIEPVDGSKWPKSWRKTEKRMVSVLDGLDEDYWKAINSFRKIPVEVTDTWNRYAEMDRSKLMRVVGKPVRIPRYYPGGRYTWDILTFSLLLRNNPVDRVIRESVADTRKEIRILSPRWCIRHLQFKRERQGEGPFDVPDKKSRGSSGPNLVVVDA